MALVVVCFQTIYAHRVLSFLNPVLRPHVDVFSSIHTPAVPARWSTGGSFYFPIGNSRGGWKCIIFCWRKLLGYEPEGAYAY